MAWKTTTATGHFRRAGQGAAGETAISRSELAKTFARHGDCFTP
jgi:hypothetical protein